MGKEEKGTGGDRKEKGREEKGEGNGYRGEGKEREGEGRRAREEGTPHIFTWIDACALRVIYTCKADVFDFSCKNWKNA